MDGARIYVWGEARGRAAIQIQDGLNRRIWWPFLALSLAAQSFLDLLVLDRGIWWHFFFFGISLATRLFVLPLSTNISQARNISGTFYWGGRRADWGRNTFWGAAGAVPAIKRGKIATDQPPAKKWKMYQRIDDAIKTMVSRAENSDTARTTHIPEEHSSSFEYKCHVINIR